MAPDPKVHSVNPAGAGDIVLDHVGLFVSDMAAAETQFERLGFTLTPFTWQMTPGGQDQPRPTGTANRCAMLGEGYLEILTAVADTPLADQLRRAAGRYEGLHLIAFGVDDPVTIHAHLAEQGFAPQPVIAMTRPVTAGGRSGHAAFTLVRVAPEAMPEGRIQCLRHETPEMVWLPEVMTHANAAGALTGVLLCVQDPAAAAERYARFTNRPATVEDGITRVRLDRGRLDFVSPEAIGRLLPDVECPSLPYMAAVSLRTERFERTLAHLREAGVQFRTDGSRIHIPAREAAGTALVFHSEPELARAATWASGLTAHGRAGG